MLKKVKNPMFVLRLVLGLCLFSCVSLNLSQAQVYTRVLKQTQAVSDVIPWYFENLISYHDQPIIDFKQVLAEDKKKGQILERIAVKLTTNYSEVDGVWYELGDFMVWQLGIRATHAASLSFVFSHLQLPEGAQMHIYGSHSKTVIGPIETSHVYEGSYATDLVGGSESVLMVLVKKDAAKLFTIQIESISQGVSRSSNNQDDRFGRAEDCNFDVNCPIGSDWKNERDATAFLYIDGAFNCTGALVNNACQDLTPIS